MFNGLPPMDAPGATLLGEVDVNRNGASPGGVAADLSTPTSPTEKAAAPAQAALGNPLVVAIGLALAFIAINARTRS